MKNVIYFLFLFLLFSCKGSDDKGMEPLSPSEPFGSRYQVLSNYYIKQVDYPNGYSSYQLERGGNRAVAIFTLYPTITRMCCDMGSPYVSFEIDPSQTQFEYITTAQLESAKANMGVTGSISGPRTYRFEGGKISGQKLSKNTWSITIEIPPKTSSFYEGMLVKSDFTVY